jgi:Outer membrane protein beta-barrel domain
MKKALFALMLFTTVSLNAQEFKKFRLGLNVGPNFGWIKPTEAGWEQDGVRVGFSAGLITDFYFSNNYGISTGLQIMNAGGRVKLNTPLGALEAKYMNQYVQLPFGLKMKTNDFSGFNIFGLFGITAEYRYKSRFDWTGTSGGIVIGEENLDGKDYTRDLRLGLNIGLGTEYNIAGSTSLFVSLVYNNGIIGAAKSNDNQSVNNSTSGNINYFAVNFGVLF